MAEPVGITGTAAGLVSLGLQLYGEISSYLAAYKGRKQDLDFAKLQCDNLKRCIDAINSAALPPTSDALTASLQSCQKELDALNDLVKRFQDPSSPAATLSRKLRERGKKLAYPFQREGLRELKERLESTVPVLQLATQTLGLDVLLATHVDLGEVKSAVDDVRTFTEDTHAGIDNLSKSIEYISISTTQSSKILPIIDERTAATSVLMAQQVEAVSQAGHQVSSHIDDSTRTVLGGISHVDYRLDKFEEILVGIAERMASQPNIMNIESVALAIMGDWPTETDLTQQVMRKLHVVGHDADIHGPFRPSIRDAVESRRHFETLKSIPIATAEVLNFPDLQVRILRQDESSVAQILKDNPSSVSDTNCFGQNSVHIAVGVGNLEIVHLILSHADALSLNSQDYARHRGLYPIEYAIMSHLHNVDHDTDGIECNGCHILDALLQSDCALYPAIFRSTFFGCTREHRLSEYAKIYLPPTQAAELDLYGENVLDETAGDVQTALEERSISVPISLRVYDSETDSRPNSHFRSLHSYLSDGATASALGLRHSCCRLAQDEGIQDWDGEEVEEVMEEQQGEILRLEELFEELKQDYEESPDLGTFVDGCWGPKVGMAIDELNARKLDEKDMKAARELGVTWHSFEDKIEQRDYSRSSDLDYWMEKLNAIVPEPDSDMDIPLAPDLPVRDL
ncbi:hypothetical protein CGCVW01_v010389 [Colletotrichum viniferum]|nr:hypothetical protein CGCVW01_v010389 [Colletotrichum viniferum]